MPDGREYAIGLGTEHEPPVDEALARLRAYAARAMPGLDPEPAGVRLCRTSILPWGADAFAVWRTGAIEVLAGANLFKFAPMIGELLAGLRRALTRASAGRRGCRVARRPLTQRERQPEVQHRGTATATESVVAPAANSAATPAPKTRARSAVAPGPPSGTRPSAT